MWDILYSQVGYIHGEGLQNRTESQVGKDQMGKGERGEKRDVGKMEGEEQNEKSRQGVLACIGLTFVTLARMCTVSCRNSEERATLNRCGAP